MDSRQDPSGDEERGGEQGNRTAKAESDLGGLKTAWGRGNLESSTVALEVGMCALPLYRCRLEQLRTDCRTDARGAAGVVEIRSTTTFRALPGPRRSGPLGLLDAQPRPGQGRLTPTPGGITTSYAPEEALQSGGACLDLVKRLVSEPHVEKAAHLLQDTLGVPANGQKRTECGGSVLLGVRTAFHFGGCGGETTAGNLAGYMCWIPGSS